METHLLSCKEKFQVQLSGTKVMLKVFWNMKRSIIIDFHIIIDLFIIIDLLIIIDFQIIDFLKKMQR